MIARLQQPPRVDAVDRDLQQHLLSGGIPRAAWIAGLFAFFSFFPYPAIPTGNNNAIQVGDIIGIISVLPLIFARNFSRYFAVAPVLLIPTILSTLKVGLTGGDLLLAFKTIPSCLLPLIAIVATQLYAPRFSLQMMTGIAAAALVHVAVGSWQYYAFSNAELPLQWIYVNPSFLSVQENADIIARWIQRPFGLFPEPSAMSCSLAPWVLLWIAEACGIVRFKTPPAQWQRTLFLAASIGSVGLIILSRSGHGAITIALVVVIVSIWFFRCKASPSSYAAVVGVFGIALPLTLYFAAGALEDRLGGKSALGNSSWEDRTNSLIAGFWIWVDSDWATVFFGIGRGLSAPELARTARLEAVWSVMLTYIYENGVMGVCAIVCISTILVRCWKKSSFNLTFLAISLVWTVGITLTTSYPQLLPLWLALGWLTVWPEICQPGSQSETVAAHESVRPLESPAPPAAMWSPKGWRDLSHVAAAESGTEKAELPGRWGDS